MGNHEWLTSAKQQWDSKAADWNSRSEGMWERGSRSKIVDFFVPYLQKGDHIIDIGCGDGCGSSRLAEKGYRVTGIDISTAMIELAKQKSIQGSLDFKTGNAESIEMKDETVNGVLLVNVLEWTSSPLTALNEIRRITKEGGTLCAAVLGPAAGPRVNSYRRLYGEDVICNTMMPWEFQKLACENGWKLMDGLPVYKEGVSRRLADELTVDLQQALSFMYIFILKKVQS
ncbi:methyltransferase domain-containing protein [Bacillus lacus]|uniref:Methyltransferase domain-containing protein n=1 Tax=Metabacillus lacus TaxID=1983721 RepID=A0A7X2IWE9_9BACI|nr:class I SAM-dependent methyltransferase [Metabacillus lacus]MRX70919.1 methyltransferase domain-containing protein [Metabacillus lacus]